MLWEIEGIHYQTLTYQLEGTKAKWNQGEHAMGFELLLPDNHTALTGDLEVQLIGPPPAHGRLQLLRATAAQSFAAVAAVPVANGTSVVKFPCGVVTLGGRYRVVLLSPDPQTKNEAADAQELDVRWPEARLSLEPKHVQTYPEVPVKASLEFPPTTCSVAAGAVIPELWMELLYCGHSPTGCADSNVTSTQVVFSQQVLGYPRRRDLTLKCELFGLAGHYVLTLRSKLPTSVPVLRSEPAHIKVAVSDKFVFNVHARSILPCDYLDGGVAVLFQYPACEPRVDRVRLFAKLRADVASLAPPTSLHYVAEQRVAPGGHSLRFSCDLFSERFVEYCFVYVNQAVTGAVTDVRMDCVPTLPVQDFDSGGWGAWSPWTQCTSSCGGGTRSRYRFCDSPPPRYGARFCEGPSLESERCGAGPESWGCLMSPSSSLPADHPGVVAEVGPGCRCGCVVHLGVAKPKRLLATSTISCPGRTFWLIQADVGTVIRLSVEHVRLPCGRQWLKVRDGDSLGDTLVAHLSGRMSPHPFTSTSNFMLLEFFSDDVPSTCRGSFVANAQQTAPPALNSSLSLDEMAVLTADSPSLPLAHILAAVFVAVVLLVSALLAAQSLFRYRKYQLAMSRESELGSAPSRSTLLSEVISLKRLRPGGATVHTRLRDEEEEEEEEECMDSEPEYEVVGGNNITAHHQEKQQQQSPPDTMSPTASQSCTPRASPGPLSRSTTFTPDKTDQKTPPPQNHSVATEESRSPPEKRRPASKRRRLNSTLSTAPSSAVSCSSVATLNNGWSSPSIRQKNSAKERKEKRNLERLLAGGCSELSLAAADTDLELDYYDYNVSNAGAVPGSFLGMDPQYLVWIPPFAPGQWEEDGELLEMSARSQHHSASDSDELTEFIPKPAARSQLSDSEETTEFIPLTNRVQHCENKGNNRYVKKEGNITARLGEKETRVEKSPSSGDYEEEDDIKFADEEEEGEVGCDIVIITDNKQRNSVKHI